MIPRLLDKYRKEIAPSVMKEFNLKNKLQVPRLNKIVVNMGVGLGAHDHKLLEDARGELALITGQQPLITKAHKAISNFKIREGSAVGCKVTLRGSKMYEFLDRLISVALPRIRDFRGISANSFDRDGCYSLGITEQVIFPEIDIDKVRKLQGMNITIVLSRASRDLAFAVLKAFGFPFR